MPITSLQFGHRSDCSSSNCAITSRTISAHDITISRNCGLVRHSDSRDVTVHALEDSPPRPLGHFSMLQTLMTSTATLTTTTSSTVTATQSMLTAADITDPSSTESVSSTSVYSNLLSGSDGSDQSRGPGFDGDSYTSYLYTPWTSSSLPDSMQTSAMPAASSEGAGGLAMPVQSDQSEQSESLTNSNATATSATRPRETDTTQIVDSVNTTLVAQTRARTSTTPSTTILQATSSKASHRPIKQGITQPILASIVPLIVVVICIVLCVWHRRRKRSQHQKLTLFNAVATPWPENSKTCYGGANQDSTTGCEKEDGETDHLPTQLQHDSLAARTSKFPRSIVDDHAPILHYESHLARIASSNRKKCMLKGGPSTPSKPTLVNHSKTFFNNVYDNDAKQPHQSQIGLAITTSPSRTPSRVSSTDSVGTIIHHAAHRLSDPFKDPVPVSIPKQQDGHFLDDVNSSRLVDSNARNKQDYACEERSQARDLDSTNQDINRLFDEQQADNPVTARASAPPPEVAQRWIHILQMEAVQAQAASAEAARKARELKQKQSNSLSNK